MAVREVELRGPLVSRAPTYSKKVRVYAGAGRFQERLIWPNGY